MRRRGVLLGSLLASLAAHAVGLAALSLREQATPRPRLPIDVELIAPAVPVGGPGPSRPPAPAGLAALGLPRAGGTPRRGAVRAAALGARPPRPAVPIASRQPLRDVPVPPGDPAPPPEARESAASTPAAAVAPGEPGNLEGDSSGVAVAHVVDLTEGPGSDVVTSAAGAAWKPPEPAERNCVQEGVRVPASLRGFVSGTLSVKFAVAPDGKPGELQILGNLPDERVGGILWRAIQGCRWTPGTDVQGRPAKVWIVMPVRFERG